VQQLALWPLFDVQSKEYEYFTKLSNVLIVGRFSCKETEISSGDLQGSVRSKAFSLYSSVCVLYSLCILLQTACSSAFFKIFPVYIKSAYATVLSYHSRTRFGFPRHERPDMTNSPKYYDNNAMNVHESQVKLENKALKVHFKANIFPIQFKSVNG
jgi:hypothetical protein